MEEKKSEVIITLLKNGPIKISGNFSLRDTGANEIAIPGDAFLCRCGKSSRQPFCDGTHKESCS